MRWPAFAISVAVVVTAAHAHADRTPQEKALAETLFREGRALVVAGKIAEGCAKLIESQRIDPSLGTLMYVATCHEEEGKTATAWIEFTEAAQAAQRGGQKDRERIARERARALEPKLSRITITPPEGQDDVVVVLDGVTLGKGSLGTALPVDPGQHTIEARASGRVPWVSTIEVAAGPSSSSIAIPPLAAEPPPAPPVAEEVPVPPPPKEPAPSRSNGLRTAGFFVGGAGIVAIGVGAAFGLRASSQASDADAFCQGRFCTPEGLAGHDDAQASALVSTIAFGVGLVAVAAGVYLVLANPKAASSASRSAGVFRW